MRLDQAFQVGTPFLLHIRGGEGLLGFFQPPGCQVVILGLSLVHDPFRLIPADLNDPVGMAGVGDISHLHQGIVKEPIGPRFPNGPYRLVNHAFMEINPRPVMGIISGS